jgi:hypothetical protein
MGKIICLFAILSIGLLEARQTAIADAPASVAWSKEFNGISDLVAVGSRIVASVTIDSKPFLVGLDTDGQLKWQKEMPNTGLLFAGDRWVLAAAENKIMTINPADGRTSATKEDSPPLGGWARATSLSLGNDFLIADSQGLRRFRAPRLETMWSLNLALDRNDSLQQLAYGSLQFQIAQS